MYSIEIITTDNQNLHVTGERSSVYREYGYLQVVNNNLASGCVALISSLLKKLPVETTHHWYDFLVSHI